MTNFEVLKQLPLKEFSNLVFHIVQVECKTLRDFEEILQRDYSKSGERALYELQHPNNA